MPAARPFFAAFRSDSTIAFSVRARSGNTIVSPALYAEPSAFTHIRLLSGHASMNFRLLSMAATVLGRSGKPFSAYSIARLDTCSKLIVPQRSSTVSAACTTPGTTAGSRPMPCIVLPWDVYQSIVAPFGAHPCPTIETTFRVLRG